MAEKAVATAKASEARQKCLNSSKQSAGFNSSGSTADVILQLQRTAGNQAVQRLIKSRALQAKLRVGQHNDVYEQEADRVAEQVMKMQNPTLQSKRKCTLNKNSSCKKDEEKLKNKTLMKKEAQTPIQNSSVPPIVNEVLHSPGQSLDSTTRAFMEPRFGHDFSNVRVHSEEQAAASAKAVNAHAYTVGQNIVFADGKYTPGTDAGKELIAHELTHVVQQSAAKRSIDQSDGKPVHSPIMLAENPARYTATSVDVTRKDGYMNASSNSYTVLFRFPSPVSFGTYEPGLSIVPPVIKEGYDGKAYTAIKNNWGLTSWERRWQIYDAEDKLLYESYYTWPKPTLYIPKDVIAKGKAGGRITPWSVWHEVTETQVPFGGSDPENFPYTYIKFYVYETWNDFMADPNAKLSDIKQDVKPSTELEKSTPLETSIPRGAGSVVDYVSVVAMHEAYLREIYDTAAKGITESAKELVSKGLPQGDAAKWANEARNALKERIRADGNPILKKVFEARNLKEYGNKLGPSYEKLYEKYSKKGLSPEEINKKIIGSSGKANIKVNRWGGRLRVAGRIMLFVDVALAGVRVYLAPEGERTKVTLEEIARIGGALAMGAAGTEAGVAAGAAIGALFGGAGAVPGAIIGGIIGGIGGALFGGWLGQTAVEKLYEMLPPSDCVFEGEFIMEDR